MEEYCMKPKPNSNASAGNQNNIDELDDFYVDEYVDDDEDDDDDDQDDYEEEDEDSGNGESWSSRSVQERKNSIDIQSHTREKRH